MSHSRQNFTDSPSTEIVRNFSSEIYNALSSLFWSDFILLILNRRRSRASVVRWIVPSTVVRQFLLVTEKTWRTNVFIEVSSLLHFFYSIYLQIKFQLIFITSRRKAPPLKIFLSSIKFLLYTCIQTKIILTPKKIQQKNKKSKVETKYEKIKYKKQANSRQATFFIFFTFIFFICFFYK